MALMWVLLFVIQALVLQSALGKATGSRTNVGIFGGEEIKIEAAPYMAALFRDNTYVCGGSIIHDRLILTSAGCCSTNVTNAHIGSSDVRSTNATIIAVTDVFIYPDYNAHTRTNDICLLRLQTRVPIHCTIAKVTLEQSRVYAGSLMNLTGWGLPEDHGSDPGVLRQAVIPVASEEDCLNLFPDKTESSFCAGVTGKEICAGDLGDPLTFGYEQVGIASLGNGPCGGNPSLYTKVSSFYSWIHDIIERM